eukprot:scaffold4985_cov116-Isochrysis_galbana.AAC.6
MMTAQMTTKLAGDSCASAPRGLAYSCSCSSYADNIIGHRPSAATVGGTEHTIPLPPFASQPNTGHEADRVARQHDASKAALASIVRRQPGPSWRRPPTAPAARPPSQSAHERNTTATARAPALVSRARGSRAHPRSARTR